MENVMTKEVKTNRVKIPLLTKIGYGTGGICSSITDFSSIYMLFFLTTIAKIPPAFAGTIMMISAVVQAICGPIFGVICDTPSAKGSKKRPFLLHSSYVYGLSFALSYMVIDIFNLPRSIYYLVVVCICSVSYAAYEVAYTSMAACLTSDNDERTKLRSVVLIVEYTGTLIMGVTPPLLLDFFRKSGFSEVYTWQNTALVLALISVAAILICWRTTKGKELSLAPNEIEEEVVPIRLSDLVSLVKFKPFLIVSLAASIYLGYYVMIYGAGYYFMDGTLKLSGGQVSFVYGFITAMCMITVALVGKIAVKIDKKIVFIVAITFTAVIYMFAYVVGIHSFYQLLLFYGLDSINAGAYWTVIYTFLYDVIELDEFKNGKRREATIMGVFSLITVSAAGIFSQFMGIILQVGGYDENLTVQTPKAMKAIFSLITLYPGLCLFASVIIILFYKITKSKQELLIENLELKREGKPYSTVGFEDLLK